MKSFLLGYLSAQLRILFRSRSTLFWVILFPLVMTLLFASLWGSPSTPKIKLGIVVEDKESPVTESIVNAIRHAPVVGDLELLGTVKELVARLEAPPPRGLDVGIVVPRGFSDNLTAGRQAVLRLLYLAAPDPWVNTSVSMARGIIEEVSAHIRRSLLEAMLAYVPAKYRPYIVALAQPIRVVDEPIQPKHVITAGQVKAWIALSMAVVEALFIGLLVGATSFHEERELGILPAILSSPVSSWSLLSARLLTAILYTAVASASAIVAGYLVGASYSGSITAVLVASAMIAMAALFAASLGLLISGLARRQEAAEAIANAVAFPLMFIGGLWIPKWMLPKTLQEFADILPISRMADAARAVIVYNQPPAEALARHTPPSVVALTLAMLLLGALVYRRLLEKSME